MIMGIRLPASYRHVWAACRAKDMYSPPVPILSQIWPSVQWILLPCRGTIYQRKPSSAVSLVRNGIK
jgi:hypothetical protein